MTEKNTPIERRTIIKAAAWAAPVVAIAATAPLAAATEVFNSPTAFITGKIEAHGVAATARWVNYGPGTVGFDTAGYPGLDSGNLTLTIVQPSQSGWALTTALVADYTNAGWTLASDANGVTVFTHAPITGSVITMPAIRWDAPAGSPKPLASITVSSDSDDVTGFNIGV